MYNRIRSNINTYNIDTCDIYVTHKLLKNKWVPIVIHAIYDQHLTFNELLSCICYISNTQLAKTISLLKEYKVINLNNNKYELTDLGIELHKITKLMQEWTKKSNI